VQAIVIGDMLIGILVALMQKSSGGPMTTN